MIDFQHEEADLTAAVGLTSEAVLAEVGAGAAAKLAGVRSRYQDFARSAAAPAGAGRLDRDRLDSLVCELYGPNGLIAKAGALITLRDRLRRVGGLALSCLSRSEHTSRMRRESLILRAFAREQVARKLGGAGEPVAASVATVDSTVARLHDFCEQAEAVDGRVGRGRTARLLVDAAHVADDFPEQRTIGDVVALALHHLAESAHLKTALGGYDSLCQTHASALRDELWQSAEAGFARRSSAGTLGELAALDLVLETLRAKLCDSKVDGAERCSAIAELYAVAASSRAIDAAASAQQTLEPLLEILRTGISAEARS